MLNQYLYKFNDYTWYSIIVLQRRLGYVSFVWSLSEYVYFVKYFIEIKIKMLGFSFNPEQTNNERYIIRNKIQKKKILFVELFCLIPTTQYYKRCYLFFLCNRAFDKVQQQLVILWNISRNLKPVHKHWKCILSAYSVFLQKE